MKYILAVGDGMADFPIDALGGKTPLEYLSLPAFARIGGGRLGRVRTCPAGLAPGSDVAFLTLLGNDTRAVYTGRSPLEAAGMGLSMQRGQVALRMNIVSIGEEGYPQAGMYSHNGSGIEGEDALRLATDLINDAHFSALARACGLSVSVTDTFRHVALMPGDAAQFELTPPHDIVGRPVLDYLPGGERGKVLRELMRASFQALNRHPINQKRRAMGLRAANSAWFWGAGTACALDNFEKKYGKKGIVISAVPLVKGIARLGGLNAPDIPGATGLLDTDYEGKAARAVEALREGYDFALVHLEAPDEMSHDGSLENKLEAIRRLDARTVAPLMEAMREPYRLMLISDHYTLLSTRTHDGTPVPFAIFDSRAPGAPRPFTESACAGCPVLDNGDILMRLLFEMD